MILCASYAILAGAMAGGSALLYRSSKRLAAVARKNLESDLDWPKAEPMYRRAIATLLLSGLSLVGSAWIFSMAWRIGR